MKKISTIILVLMLLFAASVQLFPQSTWEIRHTEIAENDSLTATTIYLPDADGWEMKYNSINFYNVDAYVYADSLADTTNYAVWQVNIGNSTTAQWTTITSTATNIHSEITDYKLSLADINYLAIRLKYYNAGVGEAVKAKLIFYNK